MYFTDDILTSLPCCRRRCSPVGLDHASTSRRGPRRDDPGMQYRAHGSVCYPDSCEDRSQDIEDSILSRTQSTPGAQTFLSVTADRNVCPPCKRISGFLFALLKQVIPAKQNHEKDETTDHWPTGPNR